MDNTVKFSDFDIDELDLNSKYFVLTPENKIFLCQLVEYTCYKKSFFRQPYKVRIFENLLSKFRFPVKVKQIATVTFIF